MENILKSISWKSLLLGCILLATVSFTAFYSYLLFHTLAELFSIIIATGVFFLAWNSRRYHKNGYLLFIGIAYLYVSFFDVLHTAAYRGMGVFRGVDDNNLPPQIWLVARYMEAFALLIAPIFFNRRVPLALVFTLFTLISTISLLALFQWKIFPDCFISSVGLTAFKISSEYIIIFILVCSIVFLARYRDRFDSKVYMLLVLSIFSTICTEFCFTLYVNLYATSNLVGHLFKIVSFWFMYQAIIVTGLTQPYDLLFRDLQQEIEERKRIELSLQNEQDFSKSLLASLPGIFYLYTYPALQLVRWNNNHEKFFGFNVGEICNRHILDWHPPENRESVLEAVEMVMQNGHDTVEAQLLDKSGRQIPFLLTGVRFDSQGKTFLMGVGQDITERKQEEALRDEIERIIQHDLRSPAGAAITVAKLLADNENLNAEDRDLLVRLGHSGQQMLDTLNQQLNIYKIKTNQYRPILKEIDALDVIRRISDQCRLSPGSKGIEVVIGVNGTHDVPKNSHFNLQCDPGLFSLSIQNLIVNAMESSKTGAIISVELEKKGEPVVKIVNQGVVPKEIRNNFFDKYVTSGKKYGTGMGTYSAKLMIEAQGGTIEMETSDERNETVITIHLPGRSRPEK